MLPFDFEKRNAVVTDSFTRLFLRVSQSFVVDLSIDSTLLFNSDTTGTVTEKNVVYFRYAHEQGQH